MGGLDFSKHLSWDPGWTARPGLQEVRREGELQAAAEAAECDRADPESRSTVTQQTLWILSNTLHPPLCPGGSGGVLGMAREGSWPAWLSWDLAMASCEQLYPGLPHSPSLPTSFTLTPAPGTPRAHSAYGSCGRSQGLAFS